MLSTAIYLLGFLDIDGCRHGDIQTLSKSTIGILNHHVVKFLPTIKSLSVRKNKALGFEISNPPSCNHCHVIVVAMI
jgi:hypothetical protein